MWFSQLELEKIGFERIGTNCRVDNTVLIIGAGNIQLGCNVRIDAFSLLTTSQGKIQIGDDVHISNSVSIFGNGGLEIGTGAGVSSGARIFTESDDYSGNYLSNPTIAPKYRNVHSAKIKIGDHALIGANSVVLPGVNIGEHSSVGALSLVNRSLNSFIVVSGVPARKIADRNKEELLKLAGEYDSERNM